VTAAVAVVVAGWNELGREEEEEMVSCSWSFGIWANETGQIGRRNIMSG
jgi:hypothetical protein